MNSNVIPLYVAAVALVMTTLPPIEIAPEFPPPSTELPNPSRCPGVTDRFDQEINSVAIRTLYVGKSNQHVGHHKDGGVPQ